MSRNQRQPPRRPATKFAHLRKKLQQQQVQVKRPTGKVMPGGSQWKRIDGASAQEL